jgi:hypothetical protein
MISVNRLAPVRYSRERGERRRAAFIGSASSDFLYRKVPLRNHHVRDFDTRVTSKGHFVCHSRCLRKIQCFVVPGRRRGIGGYFNRWLMRAAQRILGA